VSNGVSFQSEFVYETPRQPPTQRKVERAGSDMPHRIIGLVAGISGAALGFAIVVFVIDATAFPGLDALHRQSPQAVRGQGTLVSR